MYPEDQNNDSQYLQGFNLQSILLMCAMNKLEAVNARLRELLHTVLTMKGECHVVG